MITLRVFFFAILAVKSCDYCDVQVDYYQSPVRFYYNNEDKLNLGFILQNVPPEVTSYALYYQTENCDKYSIKDRPGAQCDVLAKNESIPTNRYIYITQPLNKASVRVYIELRKTITKLCSTKTILDGVRDQAEIVEYSGFRTCLNNYYKDCYVNVDFDNKCDGPPPVSVECKPFNGVIRCEAPVEELPENTIHQWYQRDNDYSFIGAIPSVTGNRSIFTIKPQKFDDNTIVSNRMSSKRWNNHLINQDYLLQTTGYEEYDVKRYYYYLNQQLVTFSCQNKANTQIGLIDPTGYHISMRNTSNYTKYFNKEDNNSKLCCLHYNIKYSNNYTANIERSVEDITLLVYEEPLQSGNDNIVTTEGNLVNNNQTESQEPISRAEVATENEKPDAGNDISKYYIGIASVAGIVILVLLMCVVIKKLRQKSSDRDQILQLETYASTNMVLYADLDMQPGVARGPSHTDDATYAEIVGVLMPTAGNVKKS